MKPTRERTLRKGDYILGSFLKPERVDGYINAVNPGDRADVLGRYPFSAASVDDAVAAAREGLGRWRRASIGDRVTGVRRFVDQLGEHAVPLAALVVRESGKPLWEARQEVQAAHRAIELSLDEVPGSLAPRALPDVDGRADWLGRGVVALVTAAPMSVFHAASASAAALLSGNAVVHKPSKFAPAVGQALAELWDRCKLPRGVFNLVQGSGAVVGQKLAGHPDIDAVCFYGSWERARDIRRLTSERPELPLLLSCGGKGAAIVLPECELDRTVYELLVGAFLTTGQRPNSTARVFIHTAVYDALVPELVRRARRLVVGYGAEPDAFMGPLVSEAARTRYRKYGAGLTQRGHTALLPAELVEIQGRRGNYASPAVYAVDPEADPAGLTEEPPGPMLLLYRCRDLAEAIELHERCAYRVATSVFARPDDPAIAELRVRLRTGALNVNRSTLGASLRLPSSGSGRASNGVPSGPELLRVLATPRSGLIDLAPFDTDNLVPGVRWTTTPSPQPGATLETTIE